MKIPFAVVASLLSAIPVLAQEAQKPNPSSSFFGSMLPMLLIMFFIIYLLMIRPEQKKQKARQAMMNNLQKGDRVVTAGGIYGTVGNVNEKSIMLKISENVAVEFTKSSVVSVLNEDGSEKQSEPVKKETPAKKA